MINALELRWRETGLPVKSPMDMFTNEVHSAPAGRGEDADEREEVSWTLSPAQF